MDQTHVVVPENENYCEAVRMPVDEYGQWIDTRRLTVEQRRALVYRPCYTLSQLLHVGRQGHFFIIAGYQWGPGNTDELPEGKVLVQDFNAAVDQGVMELLIVDRGYVDGAFVACVKAEHGTDVLIPYTV